MFKNILLAISTIVAAVLGFLSFKSCKQTDNFQIDVAKQDSIIRIVRLNADSLARANDSVEFRFFNDSVAYAFKIDSLTKELSHSRSRFNVFRDTITTMAHKILYYESIQDTADELNTCDSLMPQLNWANNAITYWQNLSDSTMKVMGVELSFRDSVIHSLQGQIITLKGLLKMTMDAQIATSNDAKGEAKKIRRQALFGKIKTGLIAVLAALLILKK